MPKQKCGVKTQKRLRLSIPEAKHEGSRSSATTAIYQYRRPKYTHAHLVLPFQGTSPVLLQAGKLATYPQYPRVQIQSH